MYRTIVLTLDLAALAVDIILLLTASSTRKMKNKIFPYFFYMVLINTIGVFFESIITFFEGNPSRTVFNIVRILDLLNYLTGAGGLFFFSMYVYEYLSYRAKVSKRLFYFFIINTAVYLIAAIIGAFTGSLSYFDEHNAYQAGDFLFSVYISPTLIFIVCVYLVIKYFRSLSYKESGILILAVLISISCYIAESIFEGLWLSHFGTAFTMLMLYATLQIDMLQKMQQKDLEIENSRVSIMLSQIQPHFLYNSLTAIDTLIYANPDKAHQAVITFSDYLRGNMDALAQKELVPLEKELEHVKQYLWLEQLRFGERLQVDFDIQEKNFSLPVLTIQPLLENAVRHGVTKRAEGGIVTLKTFKEENCYKIEIADNGKGFIPDEYGTPVKKASSERSHTGIQNVRSRLQMMCAGTLIIESEIGIGTTAIIEIPKEI